MAVQFEVQRGPLAGNRSADLGRPAARPNPALSVAIPLVRDVRPASPESLRHAAIRRRRLARRARQAAEASAWLGVSAFLTLIVVGGLAGLH